MSSSSEPQESVNNPDLDRGPSNGPALPRARGLRRQKPLRRDALGSEREVKQGYLQMRERDEMSNSYKLEKKHVILTTNALYWGNEKAKLQKKSEKWKYDVKKIVIVEDVECAELGKWPFQVGNLEELVYFSGISESERTEWKEALREVVKLSGNEILGDYHPGVFHGGDYEEWSCCNVGMKDAPGCHPTSQVDGAYFKCSRTLSESGYMTVDRTNLEHQIFHNSPDPKSEIYPYVTFRKTQDFHEDKAKHGSLYDECQAVSEQVTEVKNEFLPFHMLEFKYRVSTSHFIDVDKLAVGSEGKLHIFNPYSGDEQEDIPIPNDLIAIKSWRNRILVETKNKVVLLDVRDKSFKYSFSSKSFHHVDFIPDGSCIIGCDMDKDVVQLWKNAPSAKDILPAQYFSLLGKPKKLCVHPDPREPLVAVLIPDELSGMLFMHVYNYKTKHNIQKIRLVSLDLELNLHTVFSPTNHKMIIGYGKVLETVALGKSTEYEDVDIEEEISCLEVSPTGEDIILGHTNGSASILRWNKSRIMHSYSEKISNNSALTSVSYSQDHILLAIGSEGGNVHLLERRPPKHPSEDLELKTIKVQQCGGTQKLIDDISIDFPEGFIDVSCMEFKYGVFSVKDVGPCLFPPDIEPISAILALHPLQDGVKFKKRIRITMPHCFVLNDTDKEKCRQIVFLKAEASDYAKIYGQLMLRFDKKFQDVQITTKACSTDTNENMTTSFGSCQFDECCYFCIGVCNKAQTDKNIFYLTQIKPKSLKNAREYSVQYKLTYALPTCFRNLNEQYPDNEFDKEKKFVVFKEASTSVGIQVVSEMDRVKCDGWIIQLKKGHNIDTHDVCFWDIPYLALKSMCEEGTYPPGFTLEISTSYYNCKDTQFAVAFPGIKHFAEQCEKDLEWKVELKVEEMSSEVTKSRSPCVHYPTCKDGEQSCEALAVQKCSRRISHTIKSSLSFLTCIFSDMILSNEEAMNLLSNLQEPFEQFSKNGNFLLNHDIVLRVHEKISKNCQLFVNFCDSLEHMVYFRLRKQLCDEVEKICSSRTETCNLQASAKAKLHSAQPTMSTNYNESSIPVAIQKCTMDIAANIESPKDFLSALFADMVLTNKEVTDLQKCVKNQSTELTPDEKALLNIRIMLLVHRKISTDSKLFDTFLDCLGEMKNNSDDCQKLVDEALRIYESLAGRQESTFV